MSLMESLHSYLNVKTLGICALLLVLTTLQSILDSEVKDNKRNLSVYFCGCPCHIIHNTAHNAVEAFTQSCGFDVEDFTIDLFYWLDNKQKERMSFYASVNFAIRNTGRL